MNTIASLLLWLLMILVAVTASVLFYSQGAGLFSSVIAGAFIGVISVWFVFFVCYRIFIFITRGAPFRLGDTVLITSGDFQGNKGVVTKIVDGDNAVFVKVQDGTKDEYFEWNQLTRRKKTSLIMEVESEKFSTRTDF